MTSCLSVSGRTLWELYSVRVHKLHSAFQLQDITVDKFVEGLEGLLEMLNEVGLNTPALYRVAMVNGKGFIC